MSAWNALRNGAWAWLHAQETIDDLRANLAELRRAHLALKGEHCQLLCDLEDVHNFDHVPEDWAP